jgi:cation-transporting ATPase E
VPADDPTRGLTAAEVADRTARGQVNRPPSNGWAEYRAIVARNTLTLFNALVVPAAIALFVLKDYRGAWAVSGMAVANTLIGLVQEIRAKRHLDKLAILTETKARVRRDGAEHTIPAGDVVLGDCVLLAAGEPVVADGVVLSAESLEVDEALLTGESDPVPRTTNERVLSGSFCVAGSGAYRADKVGAESFAHRTSAEARQYRYTPSPTQRTLDSIVRWLTAAALILCAGYVGLTQMRDISATTLVQMTAATITSMVPQGLVLMATLAFVLGAVRVTRRGAVVQRLTAVEAMAAIDTVCLDKTGTLTTGRLALDRVEPISEADSRGKLALFAWATVDAGNKSVQAIRASVAQPATPFERLDQLPFKSQTRLSAVRVRADGTEYVLALGAVEALTPLMSDADAAAANARWRELLPTGLRLLLFAEQAEGPSEPFAGSLAGRRLRPLALVALSDELRPDAAAVLGELAGQGIRFKVLSGDHPETVRATVGHIGLSLAGEPVVTGDELASSVDPGKLLHTASVFGRVAPQQKLDIVAALQADGRRVAMVGDGVNDVLPIKRADLGIAMGAGTSATKTVAGIVLETNDFALLPAALDEGRVIVNNLRRAAKLFLLKNVYTVVLVLFALGLAGLEFPYLPQQVTLLNALTIGGPALLIMADRSHRRAVPPGGFLREVGAFAVAAGVVTGACGLGVYLGSAWGWGDGVETQRTVLLSMLVFAGLGNVVVLGERDWKLTAWAAAAAGVYLAVLAFPPTAYFFALQPLDASRWAVVIAAAAVAVAGGYAVSRWQQSWRAGGVSPPSLQALGGRSDPLPP